MLLLQRRVRPSHPRLRADTFAAASCLLGATPGSRKPLTDQLYVYRPEGGAPTKFLSLYGLHQLSRQYQHVGHAVACRADERRLGVMDKVVARGSLITWIVMS